MSAETRWDREAGLSRLAPPGAWGRAEQAEAAVARNPHQPGGVAPPGESPIMAPDASGGGLKGFPPPALPSPQPPAPSKGRVSVSRPTFPYPIVFFGSEPGAGEGLEVHPPAGPFPGPGVSPLPSPKSAVSGRAKEGSLSPVPTRPDPKERFLSSDPAGKPGFDGFWGRSNRQASSSSPPQKRSFWYSFGPWEGRLGRSLFF